MRALVLSGGGSLGAFQVGAIQWLAEQGASFDLFVGVSVGAINSACMAMHASEMNGVNHLRALWEPLTTGDIHKRWFPFGYVHALWKLGARNTGPLRALIDREFDRSRLVDSNKLLSVGAVAVETSEYRVFTERDPDIQKAIVASAAMPMFLEAQEIRGLTWVDGGVRNVTPLAAAINRGASDVTVVTTFNDESPKADKPNNVIDVGFGSFGSMLYEIMMNDIRRCERVNDRVRSGERRDKKEVSIVLIQPVASLNADAMAWDPIATKRMINQGYSDARNAVV